MSLEARKELLDKSWYLYRKTGDIEHYKDVARILAFYRELEQ